MSLIVLLPKMDRGLSSLSLQHLEIPLAALPQTLSPAIPLTPLNHAASNLPHRRADEAGH